MSHAVERAVTSHLPPLAKSVNQQKDASLSHFVPTQELGTKQDVLSLHSTEVDFPSRLQKRRGSKGKLPVDGKQLVWLEDQFKHLDSNPPSALQIYLKGGVLFFQEECLKPQTHGIFTFYQEVNGVTARVPLSTVTSQGMTAEDFVKMVRYFLKSSAAYFSMSNHHDEPYPLNELGILYKLEGDQLVLSFKLDHKLSSRISFTALEKIKGIIKT